MKNLFDPDLAEQLKQRILRMQPDSTRQWGSMSPTQTLAHCTSGMQMAMGTLNAKRAPFPARLLGPLIKPLVFGDDKPLRRNSPSAPELFPANSTTSDFEHERTQLLAAIDSFVLHRKTNSGHEYLIKMTQLQIDIFRIRDGAGNFHSQ